MAAAGRHGARLGRRLGIGVAVGALALLALAAWLALRTPQPFAPRDLPLPPGPPPSRVAVLGTSLSARVDWPLALAERLSGCLGRPVEVAVVARPGATSRWGLAQVARVAALDPDIVVVEFAINDADLLDGIGHGLALGRSVAVHETLLDELAALAPGARVLLMTTNHARGPRGWMRPRLAAHYAAYPGIARRHGAGLLDLYPRWLARAHRGEEGLVDGLHPDDAAARAVILDPLARALTAGGCG